MKADLVLSGGTVFGGTSVEARPTAVAVRGDRIAWIGDASDVAPMIGPRTRVVGTRGQLVVPGFCDAHVHPVAAGMQALRCDLTGATDRAGCLELIGRFASSKEAAFIVGGGWAPVLFPGGRPHRDDLDSIVSDRPVFLLDADQHNAWVNGAALALAGITRDTPDPPGGWIGRDPDGEPDGLLHEGAAAAVGQLIPEPSDEVMLAALTAGLRELRHHGITAWQDALVGPYLGTPDPFSAYLSAAEGGLIDWRVSGALWWDPSRDHSQILELAERRNLAAEAGFRVPHIKIMQDGICENQTAGMLDPYAGDGGGIGYTALSPCELRTVVQTAVDHGFGVHFHAVGDRAIRECLDSVAAADSSPGIRHQIAHVQVVQPDDVRRFRQLGVTATIQPLWAAAVPQLTELVNPVLGPHRAQLQYPFASLHRSGALLAVGSDWPVSSPDPLCGIHVAVTRTPATRSAPWVRDGAPPFLPDQALPLAAILTAYTAGSARVMGIGGRSGLIAPGRPADLAIVNRDILVGEPGEIEHARVTMTIVGGEIVFAQD
jgi:predicted amidohydrolase YtcJ